MMFCIKEIMPFSIRSNELNSTELFKLFSGLMRVRAEKNFNNYVEIIGIAMMSGDERGCLSVDVPR